VAAGRRSHDPSGGQRPGLWGFNGDLSSGEAAGSRAVWRTDTFQAIEASLIRTPAAHIAVTLFVEAAAECGRGLGSQRLPEEAATRTYTATVRQSGSRLFATFDGAGVEGIKLDGRVEPARLTLLVPGPSYVGEEYLFVDRISTARSLVIVGTVWAPLSRSTLEGEMNATLTVFEAAVEIASCDSLRHRFVMSR
jgi:hypothetical protein